jgi:hypothetical protein
MHKKTYIYLQFKKKFNKFFIIFQIKIFFENDKFK